MFHQFSFLQRLHHWRLWNISNFTMVQFLFITSELWLLESSVINKVSFFTALLSLYSISLILNTFFMTKFKPRGNVLQFRRYVMAETQMKKFMVFRPVHKFVILKVLSNVLNAYFKVLIEYCVTCHMRIGRTWIYIRGERKLARNLN